MPAPLRSRDEVVRRLFGAFRTYGFEGATLARLSQATGLGRASLYHYFPDGKEGMIREVLAVARGWIETNVKKPFERDAAPNAKIRTVMRNILAGYDDGVSSCILNVMGVGNAHDVARHDLREITRLYVSAFEKFLRSRGVAAKAAAESALAAVTQIEGALVMARALDDPAIFAQALKRLEKDLLSLA